MIEFAGGFIAGVVTCVTVPTVYAWGKEAVAWFRGKFSGQ